MFHNPQNGPMGTMAAEFARAPFAMAAGEVDFSGDAFARIGHFADELVTRRSAESVVSALQFEVCRADAGREQANAREAFGNARQRLTANLDPAGFKMDGEHHLKLKDN